MPYRIVRDVDSFVFDEFTTSTSSIILQNNNDKTEYLLERFLHNDFKERIKNALAQNIDLHKHRNEIYFLIGETAEGKKFKMIKGIKVIEEIKSRDNFDF